jgi:pimeloyl-ACP methyl ester carboxylesterase
MKRLTLPLLALASLPQLASATPKPEIVLVHGAFENAAIWQHVEQALQRDGYKTVAIDLPGRPSNPLAPQNTNLGVYRDAVLAGIPTDGPPVILVGHSFGGIVISAVAEAAPERVKTLVYVAAYLPHDGDSLASMAKTDAGSKLGPHIHFLPEKGIATVDYDARAELFANDGPPELKKALPDLVSDEPLPPLAEAVHLTSRFAHVDKVYVHTELDQVLSPQAQAAMVETTKVRREFQLDTGHTPFFTNVEGLVQAIEQSAT